MYLRGFVSHLRARKLSVRTIKATEEYLRPFLAAYDPLVAYNSGAQVSAFLVDYKVQGQVSVTWRDARNTQFQ